MRTRGLNGGDYKHDPLMFLLVVLRTLHNDFIYVTLISAYILMIGLCLCF